MKVAQSSADPASPGRRHSETRRVVPGGIEKLTPVLVMCSTGNDISKGAPEAGCLKVWRMEDG
ncbi:MAG TPA: hypothetical protein VGE39_09865, partial [Prosthecobacter sp.]